MKATGIIRRIDELGRIVIPKEIRKNLRIKEGDSLEVYVDKEEKIILRKYSIIKKLDDFAQNFTDSIFSFIKYNILITDTDTILAVSGPLKKEYINKSIGIDLEEMISRRIEILEKYEKKLKITDNSDLNVTYAVSPIIVNGDVVGLVLVFSSEENVTENEFQIAKIASQFLKTHLEWCKYYVKCRIKDYKILCKIKLIMLYCYCRVC